jgi:hypothetical protein
VRGVGDRRRMVGHVRAREEEVEDQEEIADCLDSGLRRQNGDQRRDSAATDRTRILLRKPDQLRDNLRAVRPIGKFENQQFGHFLVREIRLRHNDAAEFS